MRGWLERRAVRKAKVARDEANQRAEKLSRHKQRMTSEEQYFGQSLEMEYPGRSLDFPLRVR